MAKNKKNGKKNWSQIAKNYPKPQKFFGNFYRHFFFFFFLQFFYVFTDFIVPSYWSG